MFKLQATGQIYKIVKLNVKAIHMSTNKNVGTNIDAYKKTGFLDDSKKERNKNLVIVNK